MGVKVSALVPTITDTIVIGDEKVTVTFNKTADSAELGDTMGPTLHPGDQWAIYLSKVVTEWDVTDEDGEPWPLDAESLRKLPTALLRKIGYFIMEHDLGKVPSSNGSSPEA